MMSRTTSRACAVALSGLALAGGCVLAPLADPSSARAAVSTGEAAQVASDPQSGGTLETAASRAGSTGRKVAMSLIGLAFPVARIVLAVRRDYKEAAGVFAVGIVAVLLATPAGVNLLQDTVSSLFGSQ